MDGVNLGCDNAANLVLTNEIFELGEVSSTDEPEFLGHMMEIMVWERAIT